MKAPVKPKRRRETWLTAVVDDRTKLVANLVAAEILARQGQGPLARRGAVVAVPRTRVRRGWVQRGR